MRHTKIIKQLILVIAVELVILLMGGCQNNQVIDQISEQNEDMQEASDTSAQVTTETAPETSEIPGTPETNKSPTVMEVHFIDVGQADATLIKLDDHAMLVDCGTDEVGTQVQYYLQKQGVKKLDYLILTHPDSDHIGGADVIITKFDIDNVFMSPFTKENNWYEDLLNALSYKGYSWSTPEVGSSYSLGDASFTVIAPNRVYEDPNNSSIAFVLHYGDTGFLFTGDASEEAEADMVSKGFDLSADVYKLGHHGSSSASTDDFLDKVNPKYVVISCGTGNDYGHPHEEALQRIRRFSPEVYRTDEQGTIIARSDGNEITWDHEPSTTWAHGIQTQEEIPEIYNDIMKLEATEGADESPGDRKAAPEITYILNTNSMKFHKPDCEAVLNMNPKNRQEVDWTREECIENGYNPCGYCNP